MSRNVPEFQIARNLNIGDIVFSAGQRYTILGSLLKTGHMMELTLKRISNTDEIPTTKYIHQGALFEKTN